MKRNLRNFIAKMAYSPIGNRLVSLLGGAQLYAKYKVYYSKRGMLAEAKRLYQKENAIGTFDDYKNSLLKHWFSYNEYAKQYELYKKSEEEREEYVSRLRMAYFYWRYTPGVAKSVFRNKEKFLKTFGKYIHRKWLYTPETSYKEFVQFVSNNDCIVSKQSFFAVLRVN